MSISAYLVEWDVFVAQFKKRYAADETFLYRAIENEEPWVAPAEVFWTDSPITAFVASEAYDEVRELLTEPDREVCDQLLGALFWHHGHKGCPAWVRDLGKNADEEIFTITMKPETVKEYRSLSSATMLPALHDAFDKFWDPFRSITPEPSWLAWNGGSVVHLAQAIDDDRAFDRLPILADALEDAGCTNAEILDHCRGDDEHELGCWVVDLLLGKKYDAKKERNRDHYDERIKDAKEFVAYVSMWTDLLEQAASKGQGVVVSWHGT